MHQSYPIRRAPRYPRTLSEAFPSTAEYACSVERPASLHWSCTLGHRVALWVGVAAIVGLLGSIYFLGV